MKKIILKSFVGALVFGSTLIGMFYMVSARSGLTANSGDKLTATQWNQLLNKILNPNVVVKLTTATHNGNFGGYKSMNDWIQANGCAGYHVCDAYELNLYSQSGGSSLSAAAWYNTFISSNNNAPWANDCNGWANGLSPQRGNFMSVGNVPNWNTCDLAYNVACCQYQ